MPDDAIQDQVIALVADFTHVRAERITPRTTLFGDLGIDGDDGDEILGRFSKRFGVDTGTIQPVHFGCEGIVPWAPLMWIHQAWLGMKEKGSTPESRAGLVPITVQDLIDSAQAKRWTIAYEKKG